MYMYIAHVWLNKVGLFYCNTIETCDTAPNRGLLVINYKIYYYSVVMIRDVSLFQEKPHKIIEMHLSLYMLRSACKPRPL